jgi:hypothetical protein
MTQQQLLQDPYFTRNEVSNSDLTALKYKLSGRELPDMTEVFAFGNLVDAMITEPDRIDWWRKLMDGQPAKDFDKAKKMYDVVKSDNNIQNILKNAKYQHISIKERKFNWKGLEFTMPCRCKWDFFGYVSGDIKTTAATSQKQFEAACLHFDYNRGRAWYMDMDNTSKDILIGISKVNFKVFFKIIERNDDWYLAGKQQYTELAVKHWILN